MSEKEHNDQEEYFASLRTGFDQIFSEAIKDPKDALEKGVLFTQYEFLRSIHLNDWVERILPWQENQLSELLKELEVMSLPVTKMPRTTKFLSDALRLAEQGNLRGIKEYLQIEAQIYYDESYRGLDIISEKHGDALNLIASLIPDQDDPIEFPPALWSKSSN